MQVVFCWFLFSDELLSPVVAVFHISNTDMREVRVHNVFSVTFTVHPSFDNFLRRFWPFAMFSPAVRYVMPNFFIMSNGEP